MPLAIEWHFQLENILSVCPAPDNSEVKTDLSRDGSRRDIVSAAEGRQEVIERIVVGQVDKSNPGTPPVSVALEEVVNAHGHIEKVAVGDTWWILIVVLRSR